VNRDVLTLLAFRLSRSVPSDLLADVERLLHAGNRIDALEHWPTFQPIASASVLTFSAM
jgi:hypothetical protein